MSETISKIVGEEIDKHLCVTQVEFRCPRQNTSMQKKSNAEERPTASEIPERCFCGGY